MALRICRRLYFIYNCHTEKINSSKSELQEVSTKISQADELIKGVSEVKKLGYNRDALAGLAKLAVKHGGVKQVLKALNQYDDLEQLYNEIIERKSYLKKVESNVAKTEAENSHLSSAVEMCRRLLTELKLGIDGITTILSVAGKFGPAIEVLKAVEAYGKIEQINAKLYTLQGQEATLERTISQLAGKYQQELQNLESLNVTALTIGNQVGKVQGELAANGDIKKLLELIHNPSTDYDSHISTVLVLAYSLRQWVLSNASRIEHADYIQSNFNTLIAGLGGNK